MNDAHPLLSKDSTLRRGADLVSVKLDDEAMLMSTVTGQYYALDAVGQAIWAALEEPRTVAFLCEEISRQFEVTPEQCLGDVLAFLRDLLGDELVRVVGGG